MWRKLGGAAALLLALFVVLRNPLAARAARAWAASGAASRAHLSRLAGARAGSVVARGVRGGGGGGGGGARGAVVALPSLFVSRRYWDAFPTNRGAVTAREYARDHFPLFHIYDVVFACGARGAGEGALYVTGRQHPGEHVGLPRARATLRWAGAPAGAPALLAGARGAWDEQLAYETVSLGAWRAPLAPADEDAACSGAPPRRLELRLQYGAHDHEQLLVVVPPARAPPPPRAGAPRGARPWREAAAGARAWARAARAALAGELDAEAAARARAGAALASLRAPAPRAAAFAMCTTVVGAQGGLLTTFLDYYALLGVGAFYVFVAHPAPGAGAAAVAAAARGAAHAAARGAAVTVVEWPFPLWNPSYADLNCAQQAALTACGARYARAHETLLFYDVDELLVLPRHDGLRAWRAAMAAEWGPTAALRSANSWGIAGARAADALAVQRAADALLQARVHFGWHPELAQPPMGKAEAAFQDWLKHKVRRDFNDIAGLGGAAPEARVEDFFSNASAPPLRPFPPLLGARPAALSLEVLLRAPLARGRVAPSGREKYAANATALRLGRAGGGARGEWAPTATNIHGLYSVADPAAAFTLDAAHAYHVHLLNSDDAAVQAARVYSLFLELAYVNAENGRAQEPAPVLEDDNLARGLLARLSAAGEEEGEGGEFT